MSGDHAAAMRILGGLLEARTGQQLVAGRQWRIETALKPIAKQLGLTGIDARLETLFARGIDPHESQAASASPNTSIREQWPARTEVHRFARERRIGG